jgi:hypothetical protein
VRPWLLLALLPLAGCATHRGQAEARRTWSDLLLDDPPEPERVLAFLAAYDPDPQGPAAPAVVEARAWLDAWRVEARRWVAEAVDANAARRPSAIAPADLQELSAQLVRLVLLLGPPRAGLPEWPAQADPYPWPVHDAELRDVFFDLYVQAGRFCPAAAPPPAGCLVRRGEVEVVFPWVLAAELGAADPRLLDRVADPGERAAIEGLR